MKNRRRANNLPRHLFIKHQVRHIRRPLFPVALLLGLHIGAVMAAPQGGQVVGGTGSITMPDTNTTLINQQSHNLAIDWSSFNVAEHELVQFNQPSSTASALNRISDQNPSRIFGAIRANGNVLLVNPNGIFFGPTAAVDVNSLVASGLDISSEEFMAGNYNFQAPAGREGGLVVNQGMIAAATGGSVSLIGGAVSNAGVILANAGQVTLAAGSKMTMDFDGDGLIQFTVDAGVLENAYLLEDAVKNSGEISAAGGSVLLTGKAARDVFTNVVNNEGVISAGRIDNQGGVIRLVAAGAGNSLINTGTLDVSGQGGNGGVIEIQADDTAIISGGSVIDASSADGKGGAIHVLGDKVGLLDSSMIDVSGALGGGEVLIGGDYQGNNPDIQNASFSYVSADAVIKADAITDGDGGKVIVWADNTTRYYGEISAIGGRQSGDGGFVEVSGKDTLMFTGLVDVGSETGSDGTILLDPRNLTIQTTGSDDSLLADFQVLFAEPNTGSDVSLSVAVIEALTGNIILQAYRDLSINNALNLSNQTAGESVTFQAGRHLQINSSVTTGGGTLAFIADDAGGLDGGGGTLTINAAVGDSTTGAITFTNDGSGGIALNNAVTSSSTLTFNSGVTTGAAVALSTGAGAGDLLFNSTLGLGGQLDITAGTGNVTFTGAVTAGANNLNVLSSTTTIITAGITGTTGVIDVTASSTNVDAGIALSGAGTVTLDNAAISGVNITTVGGNITFNGATSLDTGAVQIGSGTGAGNILFNGALDGAQDLLLTAGSSNIDFSGAVGAGVALGAMTINSAANVTATSTIGAASFTQTTGTGATSFNGDMTTTGLIDITTNVVNIGGLADLSAAGINLGAVAAGITLTGANGQTSIFASTGDANSITLANLSATNNPNLTLRSDAGVTLNNSINIGSGTLQVNVDNNNSGGGATLTLANGITAGSISLAGSADGGDTLSSQNVASTFTVSGANSGTLANSSLFVNAGFSNFASLSGGTANDGFVFGAAGSLSGSINGAAQTTADSMDISAVSGSQTVNLQAGTIAGVLGGTFSNIESFTGDNAAAGDVLVAPDGGVTIALTGANDGAVTGGFSFSNFANITGGSGNDTFNVANNVTGTLRGGGGTGDDTFNISAGATFGGIDGGGNSGTGDTVTGINAISGLINIENISGSGTLTGGSAYLISGANSGTVDGMNWSGYSNLGGTSASYGFTNGGTGTLSGTITDAGTGTLDISASSGGMTVNLQNRSLSTVLNDGGANGFSGIGTFRGDNANDILIGTDATTSWTITGTNDGTLSTGFSFINFANLTGGTAADSFVLSGGSLSGAIVGGSGSDRLTGGNVTNTWTVTGVNTGSVTGVTSGFTGIENLTGGSGSDSFTLTAALTGSIAGGAGSNLYRLNTGGSVGGSITGGSGADSFDFNGGSANNVTGGAGTDTIDYADVAALTITLIGNSANGFSGHDGNTYLATGFTGIDAIVGSGGIDTLIGQNAAALFSVNSGNDTYSSGGQSLTLTNVENLTGGGAIDSFNLNGTHSGVLSGAGGDDIFNLNGGSVTGSLAGNAGTDTITGVTGSDVTGVNSGTITGVSGGWNTIENLTGTAANDLFAFSAGSLSGMVNGLGGDDLFDFNGGSVGNVDGQAGSDSLDFSGAAAQAINLSAGGSVDGFTGTSTAITGTFDNINAITGSVGVDTLTSAIAAGGTFNVTVGGDSYVNSNTLIFNAVENLRGAGGADTFNINVAHTGSLAGGGGDDIYTINGALSGSVADSGGNNTLNIGANVTGGITTGAGIDVFNFNAGTLKGDLAAGVGNDIYNFNGGSASGTVTIAGDDIWNHAAGVGLGSNITGTGSLTVPNAGLGDLIIGAGGLLLPGMTGFSGHLIIGGTIAPPILPLDGNSKVTINTSLMSVNSPILTGGDISLLAEDIDLNADISAAGAGGAHVTMIAVGDGTGGGDITGVAIPANIQGGSALFIATNNIQNAENIELALAGGDVQVIVGEGQEDPAFGQLDANSIEPTPETQAFLNQSVVTIVNGLGVTNVILGSGVQGARAVQASLAGNLIALQQIGFIDVGVFEEELTLFGVIGSGIALALAQCEELEGCAPDITPEELQRFITVLKARIEELERRLVELTNVKQRRELELLIAAYRQELQNYLVYQEQLGKYYVDAEAFENEGFGGDPEILDITNDVKILGEILNSAKQRIEWLKRLKGDVNLRARLSRSTGIDLTIDAVDEIIEATEKEMASIEAQIKLLLNGTQAGPGPVSPAIIKNILVATAGWF